MNIKMFNWPRRRKNSKSEIFLLCWLNRWLPCQICSEHVPFYIWWSLHFFIAKDCFGVIKILKFKIFLFLNVIFHRLCFVAFRFDVLEVPISSHTQKLLISYTLRHLDVLFRNSGSYIYLYIMYYILHITYSILYITFLYIKYL